MEPSNPDKENREKTGQGSRYSLNVASSLDSFLNEPIPTREGKKRCHSEQQILGMLSRGRGWSSMWIPCGNSQGSAPAPTPHLSADQPLPRCSQNQPWNAGSQEPRNQFLEPIPALECPGKSQELKELPKALPGDSEGSPHLLTPRPAGQEQIPSLIPNICLLPAAPRLRGRHGAGMGLLFQPGIQLQPGFPPSSSCSVPSLPRPGLQNHSVLLEQTRIPANIPDFHPSASQQMQGGETPGFTAQHSRITEELLL